MQFREELEQYVRQVAERAYSPQVLLAYYVCMYVCMAVQSIHVIKYVVRCQIIRGPPIAFKDCLDVSVQ